MRGRFGAMVMTTVVALTLLATVAPAALASWSLYEVTGYEMGNVVKTNSTKFTVRNNSGKKVGTVVKTASGGWKVMRGSSKIAVVKTTGTKKYPVSLYRKDGSGLRTGCCGMNSDGDAWSLNKCVNGKPYLYIGSADQDCPRRAAMGAARLLLW